MRRRLTVPAFFLLVTLVMTYPLALRLDTGVRDLGDGLLTSWIMSWNVRQLTRLDVARYFDANIFFPHTRTLAYSEHLFTQSLASLPVRAFSSNPLLAHNIVLLLAYLTSALGMYALARHLTKSRFAGVVAGLVFAFSPFMFSHFVHIQIVTAGGIPLAFLFLHRYFETRRTREAVCFALVSSLQALANSYYALYLGLFGGLFILVMAVPRKRVFDPGFWRDMLAAAAVILFLAGPFAYQYVRVGRDMGFSRHVGTPASLTSYLAASPTNRVYGGLTERFQKPEQHLFPGALALILAVAGFVSLVSRREGGRSPGSKTSPGRLVAAAYGGVALLAFLFTFGPNGPYLLLFKYLPGFNGLRVPARFHIFVMFGISVLAAFGARELIGKLRGKGRFLVVGLLPVLILVEYAAFPVPLEDFPPGGKVPEVYRWLAAQKDAGAVLEVPLPPPVFGIGLVECPRVYHSTIHWHNLVNGYSGFFPPLYEELQRRWRESPVAQNVREAAELGVRYLLVHEAELVAESLVVLRSELAGLAPMAREAARLGDDVVYELSPAPAAVGGPEDAGPAPRRVIVRPPDWNARANVNEGAASRAIDGDRTTRWNSGFQKPGDEFLLDLGSVRYVDGLLLKLGPSLFDYPRACRVDVSSDGSTWSTAVRLETPLLPIREFLRAADISYSISFPRRPARFIRIVLTSGNTEYYWSIYEFEVCG